MEGRKQHGIDPSLRCSSLHGGYCYFMDSQTVKGDTEMNKKISDCTTQELIEVYASLNRIDGCGEQVQESKNKIKHELLKRYTSTLLMLDDEQTTNNPEGMFKNILLHIY